MAAQSAVAKRPARRHNLVGPAILSGIGVVVMLNSLGWLGWNVWDTVLRLWPALLIASGLNLLAGRPSRMLSAVIVFALVVGVGAAVVRDGWRDRGMQRITESVSEPRGAAKWAEIEISAGSGTLHIDGGARSTNLVEGTVEYGPRDQPTRNMRMAGDTAQYILRSEEPVRSTMPSTLRRDDPLAWRLGLNPTLPMVLNVSTGASDATLDLAKLHLTHLRLSIGVGKTILTLPAQGRMEAYVSGGVGPTTIVIPAGMAARIEVSPGLGKIDIYGEYQRNDRVYVAPGYDTAEHRIDLQVQGGVGNITIRRAGNE